MASPQSCPGLSDDIPRERPSSFAPPSPPSGPGLVDESVASGQHNAAHWASLNPRWTMKLQHLQTSQTSHCQRMSKTWHHDMPQHAAEPTTHQALAPSAPIWFFNKRIFVAHMLILSASAKAWRQRQIKVGISFVVSTVKTWSLKSLEQLTFKWEMSNLSDSNLEKQSRNPHFHSASIYLLTT